MNERDRIKQAVISFVQGGDSGGIQRLNNERYRDFRVVNNILWVFFKGKKTVRMFGHL